MLAWKCFLNYWPFVVGIHWLVLGFVYKGPVMWSFDRFVTAGLNKLLYRQWNCQWFETAWPSCYVTVMKWCGNGRNSISFSERLSFWKWNTIISPSPYYHFNPWAPGNAWVCSQHCGYWCPGAKAPSHQYPQCWLNIHCIGPISYKILHLWWTTLEMKISFWKKLPSHLNHWGRVTHICVSKQTIIGSDNGLSPGRRQAIIWTNAGILLIGPLGTKFNEILIEIQTFSFKKMHMKMSSAKWRAFCLSLNVLRVKGCPKGAKMSLQIYLRGIHHRSTFPAEGLVWNKSCLRRCGWVFTGSQSNINIGRQLWNLPVLFWPARISRLQRLLLLKLHCWFLWIEGCRIDRI